MIFKGCIVIGVGKKDQHNPNSKGLVVMKDTTRVTLEFLATKEGKDMYKSRLKYHRAVESKNDPFYDRIAGEALTDVHIHCGGTSDIDGDLVLDRFGFYTKETNEYGDEIMSSTLPRVIALTKNVDKLADKLADILDYV